MAAPATPRNKVLRGRYKVGDNFDFYCENGKIFTITSNDETKWVSISDDEIAIVFAGARIILNNSGTIDQIILQGVNQYANDAAAAAAGIDVGALYVNSGTGAVSQRLV